MQKTSRNFLKVEHDGLIFSVTTCLFLDTLLALHPLGHENIQHDVI